MTIIMSTSKEAVDAFVLVRNLQKRFVNKLDELCEKYGNGEKFEEVTWLRDEGHHGGGFRFEARDDSLFNTASVNVSQVHYDEDPNKRLQSASAISTIIHPKNPKVPSIHIHISLTQLKDQKSYWRVMADLNPSITYEEDKNKFDKTLEELSASTFEEGISQGEKYFNIPALNRHRGVSHFYLENYYTDDAAADYNFANKFGQGIIDTYIEIIDNAIKTRTEFSVHDIKAQLDYHTLYLFQVLTLDRGTTSGLLIHNENDVGIMGSLPKFVNKQLLDSWKNNVEEPQNKLVEDLVNAINDNGHINITTKERLAEAVRVHYKKYPEALSLQASGNTIPSTVSNHQKRD